MRKALVLTLISATTLLSAPAFAQNASADKKIALGGDLQFVIPVGDFSDSTGPQIGPLFHFGYRVLPQLEITGRTGYLFALNKSQDFAGGSVKQHVSDFPLWGGVRYFFMADQAPAGVYGAAEVGFNFLNASYTTTVGNTESSTSNGFTRLGFNIGAGYVISPDLPIDIRGQFMFYNLIGKDSNSTTVGGTTLSSSEASALGIGLSVGYTYQL